MALDPFFPVCNLALGWQMHTLAISSATCKQAECWRAGFWGPTGDTHGLARQQLHPFGAIRVSPNLAMVLLLPRYG